MNQNIANKELLTLGGIASVCVGVFILSFAILSESKGIFFVPEVYSGDSFDYWIQNIKANPAFVKIIMLLPVVGFSSILIAGIALYQMISENSWQKNLAVGAYAIGVPFVVSVMASQHALLNQIRLLNMDSSQLPDLLRYQISFDLYRWMIVNDFAGPFFVVVAGTGCMAWAALRAGLLPKWLCYWAFFNAALLVISFFSFVFPPLVNASFGAPLHMIWFVVTGITLLRMR